LIPDDATNTSQIAPAPISHASPALNRRRRQSIATSRMAANPIGTL